MLYYKCRPCERGVLVDIYDGRRKCGYYHYEIKDDTIHLFTFQILERYRGKGIGGIVLKSILSSWMVGGYTVTLTPFECSTPFFEKVLSSLPYDHRMENGTMTVEVR